MSKLKKFLMHMSARIMAVMTMCSATMITAFADAADSQGTAGNDNTNVKDLHSVAQPIELFVKQVFVALLPLVAAVGAVYCIHLGLKYARAEEPQEREKAKQHVKSAIIGFFMIFILVVALYLTEPLLENWMKEVCPEL